MFNFILKIIIFKLLVSRKPNNLNTSTCTIRIEHQLVRTALTVQFVRSGQCAREKRSRNTSSVAPLAALACRESTHMRTCTRLDAWKPSLDAPVEQLTRWYTCRNPSSGARNTVSLPPRNTRSKSFYCTFTFKINFKINNVTNWITKIQNMLILTQRNYKVHILSLAHWHEFY